jgi:hypothetical protein
MSKILVSPNEGGIGVAYAHDFWGAVRAELSAGTIPVYPSGNDWEEAVIGVRAVEAKWTGSCLRLFGTGGVGRFYMSAESDGYVSWRKSIDAVASVDLEYTTLNPSGRGLSIRLAVGGLVALSQRQHTDLMGRPPSSYIGTPFASLSFGLSF